MLLYYDTMISYNDTMISYYAIMILLFGVCGHGNALCVVLYASFVCVSTDANILKEDRKFL